MERILTESSNYIILYEYEIALLKFKRDNRKIIIGDFYGDPETAFISNDEKYCVVGGDGLIIYYLNEPFRGFENNKIVEQWKEVFREVDDVWWVCDIKGCMLNEWVKFRIDPNENEDRLGTYELNVYTLEVKKIE